jgi:hypothetical protein
MKAVAAALVLIIGAAVVLWYGNTLNSWVLGGLIGGLAALLLSIPISLMLFAHLSRRHEERLREEIEEEIALAQVAGDLDIPTREEIYDVEGYVLAPQEEFWDEEDVRPRGPQRYLPAPSYQRLPIAQPQIASNRALTPQRRPFSPPVSRTGSIASGEKDGPGRRTTNRRLSYPAFPGYEPGSSRGQQQAAALRAARREASTQYDDVVGLPTQLVRRNPSGRIQPSLPEQVERAGSYVSRQVTKRYPRRPRNTVDAAPSRGALPAEGESSAQRRKKDPQTEYLRQNYLQSESIHPFAQTGEMMRRPQSESLPPDPEMAGGSLQKSLQRRAPYLYEDDPLREELAQQIDRPVVRRSSRYLRRRDEDG